MRKIFISMAAALAMALTGGAALADGHGGAGGGGWKLDGGKSSLAFGSVKKDSVGETHFFRGLSGSVSDDGKAMLEIDLASVDTNIEIRDERMNEHVFGGAAKAVVSATVDIAALADLPVGEITTASLEGTLSFLGADIPVESDVAVARLGEGRVMVVSEGMLWLSTEDTGIDAGITKLQEIAELPSITRAFPVTFRLVFERGM